jgi:hypothetical protein
MGLASTDSFDKKYDKNWKDDNEIMMTDTLTRSARVKGDRSSVFIYTHHDSAELAGLEPCQTSFGESGVEFVPVNKVLREKNEHRRHAGSTQGRKTQSRCYRPEAIFLRMWANLNLIPVNPLFPLPMKPRWGKVRRKHISWRDRVGSSNGINDKSMPRSVSLIRCETRSSIRSFRRTRSVWEHRVIEWLVFPEQGKSRNSRLMKMAGVNRLPQGIACDYSQKRSWHG